MGTRLAAQLLKAKPEQSDRQIAKQVGRDHKTVAKVRREAERRGEIPRIERRNDTKGRSQPAKKQRSVKPRLTRSCLLGSSGDGESLVDSELSLSDFLREMPSERQPKVREVATRLSGWLQQASRQRQSADATVRTSSYEGSR